MRGVWLIKDMWCRKWNAWGMADPGCVVQEVRGAWLIQGVWCRKWNAWGVADEGRVVQEVECVGCG